MRDLQADRQFVRYEYSGEARYLARALEGWPEAIDRAIAAEKERDILRTEHTTMKEALEWMKANGYGEVYNKSVKALSTLTKEESHE